MRKCVYYASIYCGLRRRMIIGRSSRCHCDVISRELPRQGVQRGAAEAGGSGGVQRMWT